MYPPITAITIPTMTYRTAISIPNMLVRITKAPKSTSGDDIRNERVTPNGSPALVNPMKIGMDEQLQNGVTVPSSAPTTLAFSPPILPNMALVRSGGKYDCMYEMMKIRITSKIIIFIVSYIKNCRLPPI